MLIRRRPLCDTATPSTTDDEYVFSSFIGSCCAPVPVHRSTWSVKWIGFSVHHKRLRVSIGGKLFSPLPMYSGCFYGLSQWMAVLNTYCGRSTARVLIRINESGEPRGHGYTIGRKKKIVNFLRTTRGLTHRRAKSTIVYLMHANAVNVVYEDDSESFDCKRANAALLICPAKHSTVRFTWRVAW